MHVLNSNHGLGGNWDSEIPSAMADSKKATDKQHWARDSKDPSGPDPSGVWENIFHLFRSSAGSGKYNLVRFQN